MLTRLIRPATFSVRSFSTRPPPATPSRPPLSEGEQYIHDKLAKEFSPSELLVQDVSGGCGTFYAITIASDAFRGMPILKQHRSIKDALKEDMQSLHGLQLKVIPT